MISNFIFIVRRFSIVKIVLYSVVLLAFTQCSKSPLQERIAEKEKSKLLPNTKSQKRNKMIELATEVLYLAENRAFVQLVYDECKVQKFGDYYVRVEDLLQNPRSSSCMSLEKVKTVSKLMNDLKSLGARNPVIFYPSVETKEKRNLSNERTQQTGEDGDVVVVMNNEGGNGDEPDDKDNPGDDGGGGGGGWDGTYWNAQYPGYKFGTDGQLAYYMEITEEFAWNNDVWVIGEEENCDPDNMVTAANDDGNPSGGVFRFQGQSEYAGIIQVTNLGAIEPWISGKLEFKMTVFNSAGAIVSGPRGFGKWKRENFKNNKWKDFGHFVGNWNTSTFGNWMYEHWMEEDGGNSNSTTITMPPPPGTSGPTVSTTIPSKNKDDDLGRVVIQFTDNINQVYNITHANIKRRN